MTIEIRIINIIFAVIGFIFSGLGLTHIITGYYSSKKTKTFFVLFFIILNAYILCILLRELTYYHVGQGWSMFSRMLFFGHGFFASTLTILITSFILTLSGERRLYNNWVFLTALSIWGFYVFLMVYNQFSGIIYTVDEKNVYERGDWYPLLITATVLIMSLNALALWLNRDRLSQKQKQAFLIYIIIPTVSMIIQTRFFGINLISLSTAVAALLSVSYIITDQANTFRIQEQENTRLRADIMLAQIQPHFLFNTLTVIRQLCRDDPEKAERGVTEFAKYLRHNMDSLNMDRPIPFKEELEHVREYLELLKLRFGDELNVEYDLEYTDFEMPTLTLQPLVENAVLHGVRANDSGRGMITIRSKSLPDHTEVIVEDNGVGFDTAVLEKQVNENNGGRSHMGLINVKRRLSMMCDGRMEIESEPGGGTVVRVVIPNT